MDDHDWIQGIKRKEPEALQMLWELVRRYGYRAAQNVEYEPSRAEEIAEDAATGAYFRVLQRGVHKFQFRSTFATYCRKIVSNEVYRILRRERRRPTQPLADEMEDKEDERLDGAEMLALLKPCLEQLPPLWAEVVQLCYLQELNNHEIAALLGISHIYVGTIKCRALKRLQQCMRGRGFSSSEDLL